MEKEKATGDIAIMRGSTNGLFCSRCGSCGKRGTLRRVLKIPCVEHALKALVRPSVGTKEQGQGGWQ